MARPRPGPGVVRLDPGMLHPYIVGADVEASDPNGPRHVCYPRPYHTVATLQSDCGAANKCIARIEHHAGNRELARWDRRGGGRIWCRQGLRATPRPG